ncbi:MAG: ABC transporter permease [Chitinophagia bacterium]|nr:ABC transporter permease [Chitinophagia bacterium]
MILRLTWRNLWRNPRRTLITAASVVFAVVLAVFMQSLQQGTFDRLVRNVVGFHSGYAQVHARGYWDEPVIDNAFPEDDSLSAAILAVPGVRGLVPRLECYALASAGEITRGCRVTGISPSAEDAMTRLASRVVRGRYLRDGSASVLLAAGLARRLGIDVGDTLVLLGQGYHGGIAAGRYPVAGIVSFRAPQLDASMVYLTLEEARVLLGSDGLLTSLAIDIEDPGRLGAMMASLSPVVDERYELMSWQEMMPEIDQHIRSDAIGFYVWTGVLYLIIAFGIFSTLLMMTAERKQEFGMLVAIGMRRGRVAKMLMAESLLISLTGVFAGMALSLPLVLFAERHPIRFVGEGARAFEQWGFEPVMPTITDPAIFLRQSAIVLAIAVVTGLYPAWKAMRIDPVSDMRR